MMLKIMLLALGLLLMPQVVKASEISVSVDGSLVAFADAQPIIVNGTTLVPVRGVFGQMGFSSRWDAETYTALFYTLGRRTFIYATVGDSDIRIEQIRGSHYVERRTVRADVPPMIVDGRLMLPLRAVAEATGAQVQWLPDARSVSVLTRIPTPPIATWQAPRRDAVEPRGDVYVVRGKRSVVPWRHVPFEVFAAYVASHGGEVVGFSADGQSFQICFSGLDEAEIEQIQWCSTVVQRAGRITVHRTPDLTPDEFAAFVALPPEEAPPYLLTHSGGYNGWVAGNIRGTPVVVAFPSRDALADFRARRNIHPSIATMLDVFCDAFFARYALLVVATTLQANAPVLRFDGVRAEGERLMIEQVVTYPDGPVGSVHRVHSYFMVAVEHGLFRRQLRVITRHDCAWMGRYSYEDIDLS